MAMRLQVPRTNARQVALLARYPDFQGELLVTLQDLETGQTQVRLAVEIPNVEVGSTMFLTEVLASTGSGQAAPTTPATPVEETTDNNPGEFNEKFFEFMRELSESGVRGIEALAGGELTKGKLEEKLGADIRTFMSIIARRAKRCDMTKDDIVTVQTTSRTTKYQLTVLAAKALVAFQKQLAVAS